MKELYVWYSAATDVTGKIIKTRLNAGGGGTSKPAAKYTKILCWGTKTKDAIALGAGKKVYNHPDKIRVNRNKLGALKKMREADCSVADFSTNHADVGFPLIARTNYHQGGAGFWTCLNADQVNMAVQEGAQYFQKYINVRDEYRLHVVDGKVIYAVKKVARNNLKEAFVAHHKKVITNFAEKNNKDINNDTLDFVLGRLSRKMATSVDMITRSNTRGWKFSRVNMANLNKDLHDEAIKSVRALSLTFAAVDCCVDDQGRVWIIECNTGPGLEGSSLEAWITALEKLVEDVVVPKGAKAAPMGPKAGKKARAGKESLKDAKARLKERTRMMDAMLDAATDEAQVEAVNALWKTMGLA